MDESTEEEFLGRAPVQQHREHFVEVIVDIPESGAHFLSPIKENIM